MPAITARSISRSACFGRGVRSNLGSPRFTPLPSSLGQRVPVRVVSGAGHQSRVLAVLVRILDPVGQVEILGGRFLERDALVGELGGEVVERIDLGLELAE